MSSVSSTPVSIAVSSSCVVTSLSLWGTTEASSSSVVVAAIRHVSANCGASCLSHGSVVASPATVVTSIFDGYEVWSAGPVVTGMSVSRVAVICVVSCFYACSMFVTLLMNVAAARNL